MLRRNDPTGTAFFTAPHPPVNAGSMDADNGCDSGGSTKAFNDRAGRFHSDHVALIATQCNSIVAIIAPHSRRAFRYTSKMLKLHEWVRQAHKASGLSGSELSRQLYAKLGRETEDRSIISKMSKEPGSAGTKARRTSLEDLVALAEITNYPVPDELLQSMGAYKPPRQIDEPEPRAGRQSPLRAEEVDEPIDGRRAIEAALRRIVGLTDGNVTQILSLIESARAKNGVPLSPDQPHDQHEPTTRRHAKAPST